MTKVQGPQRAASPGPPSTVSVSLSFPLSPRRGERHLATLLAAFLPFTIPAGTPSWSAAQTIFFAGLTNQRRPSGSTPHTRSPHKGSSAAPPARTAAPPWKPPPKWPGHAKQPHSYQYVTNMTVLMSNYTSVDFIQENMLCTVTFYSRILIFPC